MAKVIDVAPELASSPSSELKDALEKINEERDTEGLNSKFGGVSGLAQVLGCDTSTGLISNGTIEELRNTYGPNIFYTPPPKSFFSLCVAAASDPIVLILIAAAIVSTGLGAGIPEQRANQEYIEGIAIFFAVFVVIGVGAGNDYQKDRQFRKLTALKDELDVKVLRKERQAVKIHEIVVGDVIFLVTGDKVAADGVVLESDGLKCDEASLTGESDPVKKSADGDIWVRSGTQVVEGSGRILVTAVGNSSQWGKIMLQIEDAGDDETPLQAKLEVVAGYIGKVGLLVAVCCFIALLIGWCVANNGFPISQINNNGPIQFFLYAVTIIVVAVPEGLPLAVTISLAYSMMKMMKDNNFVRVLAACETMGGATAICSDKTGTLTENKMTVVRGWFVGRQWESVPSLEEIKPQYLDILSIIISMTSQAFLEEEFDKPTKFFGSRTECALLVLLKKWGCHYKDVRDLNDSKVFKRYDFSSGRKMSSIIMRADNKLRLYNKGAAEWVLERCAFAATDYGEHQEMTAELRAELLQLVIEMAKSGLRCLCLAYTDIEASESELTPELLEEPDNFTKDMTLVAIVGLKDPLRKEVPEAVRICKLAGITVRMVTGDNVHTACHIARECGILEDQFTAMEGPQFRETSDAEMLTLLPDLRVLARSSPTDKLRLVVLLKSMGEVVAVTGDGTNDAPALKESDVGLAMGISGTDVAKEAADIIIMDDNFSSIVKSVLWGRSVFNNIRKFLQFQLTVNFVALVVAFIGAVAGGHQPLNVIELLWVNMIMDTMGALALATEEPSKSLLLDKPYGRTEALITMKMWKHILVQGFYQMIWLFLALYVLPNSSSRYTITTQDQYYATDCVSDVTSNYPSWNSSYVTFTCGVMSYCGFPAGSQFKSLSLCPLSAEWNQSVPSDLGKAVCYPLMTCQAYNDISAAQSYMSTEFTNQQNTDWRAPLSVLFNIFIMCQVANEINSRRINDEYNVFEKFFDNLIFLGVILVTMIFQVIIIETLGLFFQVNRLNWAEWLASIAIGAFSIPVSIATRYISRVVTHQNKVAPEDNRTQSGRTTSGRTASGRTSRLAVIARNV